MNTDHENYATEFAELTWADRGKTKLPGSILAWSAGGTSDGKLLNRWISLGWVRKCGQCYTLTTTGYRAA